MEPERFSYHLNLVYVFLRFFSHVLLYIIIHGKKDLKIEDTTNIKKERHV